MTYFRDDFYWRPCKGKYNSSIHLYINDGHTIRLDLDDCKAVKYGDCECNPECGFDNTALSTLTIDELKDLRNAMNRAVEFYETRHK